MLTVDTQAGHFRYRNLFYLQACQTNVQNDKFSFQLSMRKHIMSSTRIQFM